jgi:hypothetical protein
VFGELGLVTELRFEYSYPAFEAGIGGRHLRAPVWQQGSPIEKRTS